MTRVIPRFAVAALAAVPVAALLAFEAMVPVLAGLDLDNHTVPFVSQLGAAVFLVVWAALIYWAAWETDSIRRAVSRTCWAFTTTAFLLPFVLIVYEVTTPPEPDTIFPRSLALMVFAFFGVVFGCVSLLLAVLVSPRGAAERSPGGLFTETSETVRRVGATRIALALTLLIAGVVVLRIGSAQGFWSEKYTAIATGISHTCGIRTDGTAHCWGDVRAIPPLDQRFVAIAPGAGYTCGLREDGSLSCWGNIKVQSQEPFSEISAGGWHICALRPDGTVECWGLDLYGYIVTSPPDGELFTKISAGPYNTCGIRPDGTGVCWGSVESPSHGEQFKAISNGWDFACGIRLKDDILCWGSGASPTGLFTVEGSFVALSSGNNHACALRPDGSVHCWGASSAHETNDFGSNPVKGDQFVSISSGSDYNCGLRQNGTVKCWGGNWLDRIGR